LQIEVSPEGSAKKLWYIRLKDGAPMVFACLWDTWKPPEGDVVASCTIGVESARRAYARPEVGSRHVGRGWSELRRIMLGWRTSSDLNSRLDGNVCGVYGQ
jgi:hypothetical protein